MQKKLPTLSKIPFLDFADIHLWFIPLKFVLLTPQTFSLLSTEEKEKAMRFKQIKDESRYVAAHIALRRILGYYCGACPEQITFHYNSYLKPSLSYPLQFNFSHSENMALCGISKVEPIGVDIECIQPINEINTLISSCFSSNEQLDIADLPLIEKRAAFYKIWSIKESFVKAKGIGLQYPLTKIEVDYQTAQINRIDESEETAKKWSIQASTYHFDLEIYQYATAIQIPKTDITTYTYDELFFNQRNIN